MSEVVTMSYTLPSSLVTLVDLRRLINEVEQVDAFFVTKGIQDRVGHQTDEAVTLSRQLSDFLTANTVDIYNGQMRSELIAGLRQLKNDAPVIHATFAVNAGHDELAKIVDWLRQSVHPQVVMTIGLQPDLIGGVSLRTTNKVFDLSIRSQLASGRQIIVKELEAMYGAI